MSKALFLSPAELKKSSIIDGNTDDDKIKQFIEVAQDLHIQNYTGSSLYRQLQSIIIADTVNDVANTEYKTLLVDYIKPMLIWYTMLEYLPWALFNIANGGVFRPNPESAIAADTNDAKELQSNARDKAEFYTRRFIDYVCDKQEEFPEYFTQDNNSDLHPGNDSGHMGWVL